MYLHDKYDNNNLKICASKYIMEKQESLEKIGGKFEFTYFMELSK